MPSDDRSRVFACLFSDTGLYWGPFDLLLIDKPISTLQKLEHRNFAIFRVRLQFQTRPALENVFTNVKTLVHPYTKGLYNGFRGLTLKAYMYFICLHAVLRPFGMVVEQWLNYVISGRLIFFLRKLGLTRQGLGNWQ